MKSGSLILLVFFFSILSIQTKAQTNSLQDDSSGGIYPLSQNDAGQPCISQKQYEEIEKQCAQNIKALGLPFKSQKGNLQTSLNWPLKAAPGLDDCSYYIISAHVDQDFAPTTFKDYNCGTITYDGHKGTDIATFPYGIYKLDHDEVQVIAAAAGTIINKVDGNFDKNCGTNNLTANYIVIQHADGSTALYLHMKKNSLTTKSIGATVAVGEFLGVVGSSGNSSGPHLHFEVWSGSTSATYIDPFSGTCNSLNSASWWATQKPYTEPQIVKSSVNTTDIVVPGCPVTETPNESSCYTIPFQGPGLPAGYAKFYIFIRNETTGMVANMSILNPDGTVFNSWTYTSTASYNASWRTWSKTLPTKGGTYTFKATYNGISCEKKFDIVKAEITALGPTTVCAGGTVPLQASLAKSYLWSNGDTTQTIIVTQKGNYTVTITNVYGCTSVSAPVNVEVIPPPAVFINADGPTTFCEGGSVKLTSSTAKSYLWSTGETTQEIIVSTSGTYKVTITDNVGCPSIPGMINVTVFPKPNANINIIGSVSFCEGGSVQLSAEGTGNYIWSNGASGQNIIVNTTGNYQLTITNTFGCSAVSNPVNIIAYPKPIASINATGPLSFCKGESINLISSPAQSYLWSTGESTQSIKASLTGTYFVTITDQNGCSATAFITTIALEPQNDLEILVKNDSLFSPYSSPNNWFITGNSNPISSGLAIPCEGNGIYYVTGLDINGCLAKSDTIAVNCNSNATNNHLSGINIQVFPNPFNEYFHLFSNECLNGQYSITIRNMLGQIVLVEDINVTTHILDKDIRLANLSDGIYSLTLQNGFLTWNSLIVKHK